MYQVPVTTENLILLSEYSNPTDFVGYTVRDNVEYVVFSKLSEKLLAKINENKEGSTNASWFSSYTGSSVLSTSSVY